MTHIMLDLETWGKRPGCDIRSIGACVFDPLAGTVSSYDPTAPEGSRITGLHGLFYIACDNPNVSEYSQFGQYRPKYPLTRDPDTVQWWSEQSDDAQAAFADPVEVRQCLMRFGVWLASVGVDLQVGDSAAIYAHGPQFDCSILEAAYHAVGLPVPWHYRAPRDTRTVFDLCGVGDHSEWMKQYPVGTAHHALDDAISQARAVCGAMEKLA